MIRRLINWMKGKIKPPTDFGPHGVLMRDPVTDKWRPMQREDFESLNVNVLLLDSEGWVPLEIQAAKTYGPAILRPQ